MTWVWLLFSVQLIGMLWWCCCVADCDAQVLCTGCSPEHASNPNAPGSWTVVVAGIVDDDDCTECILLNGTYIFDDASTTGIGGNCVWQMLVHVGSAEDPYVCSRLWAYSLGAYCSSSVSYLDFKIAKYPSRFGTPYSVYWKNTSANCYSLPCTEMESVAVSLDDDDLDPLCVATDATCHISCRTHPDL